MKTLLSASLIVRDESKFLADCLESITGIVDEIVVVDTGSVDGTPDIARSFGATVVAHEWNDHFAEARNVSLDLANGEWILYIDADERLVGADRSDVEKLLTDAPEVAFRILLQPYLDSTTYREYRLWRNDPRIRFDGIIHEKVVPAIHKVSEEDGRPIGLADLKLVHYGYEGDQARKHSRNLPLLRRQLEVEPENLFARHHLARILEVNGDVPGAEEALVAAIETARATGLVDPVAALSYADLIRLRLTRGEDITGLLSEALGAFPDNCVLLWISARKSIDEGNFEDAIGAVDKILAVDWAREPDHGPAYGERLVGEMPWSTKALCLFRLGRYEEAADAYAAAASFAPWDPSYPLKEKLARAKAAT